MPHPLFERHRDLLDKARHAIRDRSYWSAYPEVPSGKIYGESAKEDGENAFKARLHKPFALDLPGSRGPIGGEASPYGFPLGVTYPRMRLDDLIPAMRKAMSGWAQADVETRVGVCMEILHRLNKHSFEIAYAVMHTTGQGFMMAFQAGGPHAQDRGLEAVAHAYEQMRGIPANVTWEKQVTKTDVVRLEKTYRIVPRGISAVVGCSTFPTWNSYPALFASLATGNAVIIKPHPGAALPLAITVQIAREVVEEAGFDPNVLTILVDSEKEPITKELVTRPEVKIVDYTGSSSFGEWIEKNASQALVFTEKAGVNSAIIHEVDDLKAVTGNLAFTLSLYSGQMCTTTQNIYVPRDGIKAGREGGRKTFDEVAQAIVGAVDWFLSDPKRAAEVLGAVQNQATVARIEAASREGGTVLRESQAVSHDAFPGARMRSPLILKVGAGDTRLFMREMFGPIVYIVAVDDVAQAVELASRSARELGAITWALYSGDQQVIHAVQDAAAEVGVPLSINLTGQIFVNQSAAFSDYHVTGCNPSGNATLTDAAFIAGRFRVTQSRIAAPPVIVESKPAAQAAVR